MSTQNDWRLYIVSANELFGQIDQLLHNFSSTNDDDKDKIIRDVEIRIVEINERIDELQELLTEFAGESKKSAENERIKRTQGSKPSMRRQLLGEKRQHHSDEYVDMEGLSRMNQNTRNLEEGTLLINQSLRNIDGAQVTAASTIQHLQNQGETLHRAGTVNDEISNDLQDGAHILRRIFRRSQQSRVVLVVLITIIALLIIILFIGLIVKMM
ncbi:MAG: hypothetical protein EZS28_009706 [Streblomastix strix]|uniref:t-SNARE coiled-coil homology domain-containing protein n=1 Tax=Streblomastix strix TaxID=222440 RepID=A0A5J4WKF1_9EUKA|nr:MAG: hypothetical protein EZS28_009706 [Streblomastix strix]